MNIIYILIILLLRAHCFIFSKSRRNVVCQVEIDASIIKQLLESRAMLQIRRDSPIVLLFLKYTFELFLLNIIRVLWKSRVTYFKEKTLDRLLVYRKHEILFPIVCHIYMCIFAQLNRNFVQLVLQDKSFNDASNLFIKLYVQKIYTIGLTIKSQIAR